MKELNIRIEYPSSFKSQEVLSAVRDYLIELADAIGARISYKVEDINDIIDYGKENGRNI